MVLYKVARVAEIPQALETTILEGLEMIDTRTTKGETLETATATIAVTVTVIILIPAHVISEMVLQGISVTGEISVMVEIGIATDLVDRIRDVNQSDISALLHLLHQPPSLKKRSHLPISQIRMKESQRREEDQVLLNRLRPLLKSAKRPERVLLRLILLPAPLPTKPNQSRQDQTRRPRLQRMLL